MNQLQIYETFNNNTEKYINQQPPNSIQTRITNKFNFPIREINKTATTKEQ